MPDLAHDRKLLPTYEFKQDLIDAIREHAFLVIIGETGMLADQLQTCRLTCVLLT